MSHKHSVFDTDTHFEINPITRAIKNTSAQKTTVIQYDHNSERFSFSMPRTVEGHDMMQCDRVEVHFNNIDTVTKDQSEDIYTVGDMQHSPDNSETVVFSWLLTGKATKYAGLLAFAIRFSCHDENNVEVYGWGTLAFTGISVSGGVRNDAAAIIEPYTDILAQWEQRLFGAGDSAVQQINDATEEQKSAIEAKGAAVLASIPAEYADLSALADDNFRCKAGAIIQTAAGESVAVSDASDYPLSALTVYGRSAQDGTPTPENPAEINSVDNPAVSVCGVNLWDEETELGYWQSMNGESYVVNNQIRSKNFIPILPNTKIYITAPNKKIIDFVFFDSNKNYLSSKSIAQEITSPVDAYYMHINLRADYGTTYNHDVCISLIPLNGAYEATAGNQTANIPRTLRGIPVVSGGNYTDENGQQWIADEIDFERGMFVQRTAQKSFELYKSVYEFSPLGYRYQHHAGNGFTPSNMCLCKTLPYNIDVGTDTETTDGVRINGDAGYIIAQFTDETGTTNSISLEILYALAEPIETPLSDVEITAFRALHTNKPNTTILNDSGAYMAAEYVADTKTYIDNKIAEMIGGEKE